MNAARAVRPAVVRNRLGLHARPAAKFVRLAAGFEASVTVAYQDMRVPGNSLMGLLMLGAATGAEIRIEAVGVDAEAAVAALARLVEEGFGEA